MKSKLRFRFSLRSLGIFVTLVCLYFGCWEITKSWVVEDLMSDPVLQCESPVPFVVVLDEIDHFRYQIMRRYHFCCLGFKAKLPYARECPDRRPLVMGGVIPRIIIIQEEEEFEQTGYEVQY